MVIHNNNNNNNNNNNEYLEIKGNSQTNTAVSKLQKFIKHNTKAETLVAIRIVGSTLDL